MRRILFFLLASGPLAVPSMAIAGSTQFAGAWCVGTNDEDDISRQWGAANASDIDLYCSGWGVTPTSSTVDASNVDAAFLSYYDGDGAPYITATFCLDNADDLSEWDCGSVYDTCSEYGCAAQWFGSGTLELDPPEGSFSSAHNMNIYVTLPSDSRVISYSFDSY